MKKIISFILLFGFIFGFTSCKKILEVTPRGQINAEGGLSSPQSIEASVTGVYSYLREIELYGRQYIVYPELLSDNARQSGRTSNLVNISNNTKGNHLTGWESAYAAINQINVTLDALENFAQNKDWRDGLAGQLYFLRALYYHNLARTYGYDPTAMNESVNRGSVPIVTKGVLNSDDIDYPARATQEEVYDYIYKDLDSAYILLENTPDTRAPHHATRGAVAALYTRVALYNGDWDKVIEQADLAINSGVGDFSSTSSYVADWRKETHPESMFEVQFLQDQNIGVNSSVASTFTTHTAKDLETRAGNGYAVVADALYNLYEDDDVRKDLIWFGVGPNANLHENSKFSSRGGILYLDNIPVIRLSEVYLNRAEAYAHLPNSEGFALDDLNKIRERAGLAPAVGLAEEVLIDEIIKQRRLELAFEGDRFYTLKRLGEDITKPDGTVLGFDDYRILPRIPYRERNSNRNLTQNRGY